MAHHSVISASQNHLGKVFKFEICWKACEVTFVSLNCLRCIKCICTREINKTFFVHHYWQNLFCAPFPLQHTYTSLETETKSRDSITALQRWPESLFQTPTPLLFQHFWIRARIRARLFFKFETPIPVQTPATIIDPTVIFPCFHLINDHTDSCHYRNWKVTPDPGPVIPKFLTPDPKKNAESCQSRLRSHLWKPFVSSRMGLW